MKKRKNSDCSYIANIIIQKMKYYDLFINKLNVN